MHFYFLVFFYHVSNFKAMIFHKWYNSHTDMQFEHSIPSQSIICIPFILTLAWFRRWNISRWKIHTPLINVTRRKAENFLNLKSVAASLAVSWPAEQQPELLRHKSDCDREDYFTRQLANIRLSKQIRWLFRDRDWVPSWLEAKRDVTFRVTLCDEALWSAKLNV